MKNAEMSVYGKRTKTSKVIHIFTVKNTNIGAILDSKRILQNDT